MSFDVEISKYLHDKCVKFAEERIAGSKSLYAYRGESKSSKMVDDIVIGTLGEWGVYKFLRGMGFDVKKPDMRIYEKKRKSFASDLSCSDFNYHVKSQGLTSFKRYGASWLLQRTDKIVVTEDRKELLVFVNVDGLVVSVLGVVRASDISNEDLWSECKVPRYRHSKVALYWDDIKHLNMMNFMMEVCK